MKSKTEIQMNRDRAAGSGVGKVLEGKLFLFLGIAVALILPHLFSLYTQHIFILVLFYAFAASAWNIVCGYLGVLSLGHAVYIGIGGYVSTLLLTYLEMSPWLGMFAGAAITGIIGLMVGFPCFRLKGPYFTLTSIALAEILRIWVENNETLFGLEIKGSMGLLLKQTGFQAALFDFKGKIPYYYIILAFLAITLLIVYLIDHSKLGFYFVAIRSDPAAAESLGIRLTKYKLIAMFISVFIIAFAGTFYAQYFRYINPTRIFGVDLSIRIALLAMVGGQGKVFGPLFGAVLLVPVTELLSQYLGGALPGLHLFIYGVVMMLVVYFMPQGIHDHVMGFFRRVEGLLLRGRGSAAAAGKESSGKEKQA